MAKALGGLDLPVNESQGGTNATTFNAARTNMGLNPLISEKTLTYNVVSADRGLLIHYSGAGGVDLTLDPAATLGDGFNFILRNDAVGNITINPNGAELINGAATLVVEPTQAVTVFSTGAAFYTEGQASLIDGANQALSNLAAVAINASLVSNSDIADDLGSLTIRWDNAYLRNVSTGDTAADVLTISAWDVDGAVSVPFMTLTANNTPTCALSGDVTSVTQAPATNTAQIATCAFVQAAVGGVVAFPITLAQGGTNANLTASNGGIFYSTATAGAILSGTATAGQIIRSGSSAAPSWSTATYPATVTANRLLYASATNVISDLAMANSSVLVTDGSGVPSLSLTLPNGILATTQAGGTSNTTVATTAFVQAAASSGGGLTLLSTATAAGSATINFNNFLSSTYETYLLVISGLVPATNATVPFIRVGTGAGPTYQSGASDYTWSVDIGRAAAGSWNTTGDTADSEIETVFYPVVNTTTYSFNANIDIYSPTASIYTHITGVTSHFDSTNSQVNTGNFAGIYLATTAVTSIQVLMSSGNIASGEFKLYGYKKT